MLANQGGLEPFFDQPLARPRDRVDTALQRRRDLAVAPALTTVRGVGFQQDPGLQQLLCWMVSAMDKGGEMLSLLIAQCHYIFLYRDLFPGHQSAPSAATEPSSQTNAAESMTEATSMASDCRAGGAQRNPPSCRSSPGGLRYASPALRNCAMPWRSWNRGTAEMSRTVARLLAESLEAHDVDQVYCVPGESYVGLTSFLLERNSVRVIVCRHEAGAGYMAVADGRLRDRAGVAVVSRGPGLSNAMVALHSAYHDE